MRFHLVIAMLLLQWGMAVAQTVPSPEENIDFITTFGAEIDGTYGDDDGFQTFFFIVPENISSPIYFHLFDPDCGGRHDLAIDGFNTSTAFELYGGYGAYSDTSAQGFSKPAMVSGNLLYSKVFEAGYGDDRWVKVGPFNPAEGEYIKALGGYVFKWIILGRTGNDGNVYRMRLSLNKQTDSPVPGANAFTFKYTFRLKSNKGSVAHIYPLIGDNVIALKQHNFDFDNEGKIRLFSVDKNGIMLKRSGEGNWVDQSIDISPNENGKSMNIQFLKSGSRINDMTIFILNQYNKAVPLYAIPIGGIPRFKPKYEIQKTYQRNKIYMR